MSSKTDMQARDKVWDMIKDIRISLMVTRDKSGRLFARPMAAQEQDGDGRLWFFTERHSPKVEAILANSDILLSYSEPAKNNYVSITGHAEIVHDRSKIKELWSEAMTTWFPQGAEDTDICLIRVTPDSAEYWDAPSSTFVYVYGYMKAKLTGEQPDPGENRTVRMTS